MKGTTFKWRLLGSLIFFVDQMTKTWALRSCEVECRINPVLFFETTLNRGISWGYFHSSNNLVFFFITILIVTITQMVYAYAKGRINQGLHIWGETLVIAGSVSNIFDRLQYGGVVDFIVFHYKEYAWPHFNIADACIVIGVMIMFFHIMREK